MDLQVRGKQVNRLLRREKNRPAFGIAHTLHTLCRLYRASFLLVYEWQVELN
jgi:hypothetical protein